MYLDSTIHKIYYTTTGNPNGMPVLLIHGGPGSGSSKKQADLLDKNKFYIVQIDQRGCGKSTPQGLLIENTTNNLILDIENVRKLLKIDKWVVVGGSWGGSLAIIYSYFFPENQ
jgi:proline iminopeptidase